MERFFYTSLLMALTFISSAANAQDKVIIGIGEVVSSIPGADPHTFQTMLETQLIKTNKFTVIERDRLAQILQEQGLSEMGLTSDGNDLGGIMGVDYLVYGSITKLGSAKSSTSFGALGAGGSTTEMAVDIRIVDTKTGEVILADTVENSIKAGGSMQVLGMSSSSSKGDPLSDVQRLGARGIVGVIATTIYPAKIIAIQQDGTHILNYGDGLFQEGDFVKVFSVGEGFADPDTGEVLGAEEIEIGMLKVTEAAPKFTKASLISGENITTGNVVKKLSDAEIAAAKKAEEANRKSKRKRL
jgi:curli biogenesis system outer membrane secretion channel CsgG